MTVIAAKIHEDSIKMSCDSMVSRGWHKKTSGYPEKIIEGRDFIVGMAGICTTKALLTMYSKNHPIGEGSIDRIVEWGTEFLDYVKKKTGNWDSTDSTLLLAHVSGLYMIESWLPIEISDWCAIGSGYQHAEAALYLGHDTEKAVDVAVNLEYGCGGKIITKSLSLKNIAL